MIWEMQKVLRVYINTIARLEFSDWMREKAVLSRNSVSLMRVRKVLNMFHYPKSKG